MFTQYKYCFFSSRIDSENFSIARIVMTKIKQNLVVFMDKHENPTITSVKAGNMCLNRFCIEEDAAIELSEVYYLKNRPMIFALGRNSKIKLKERRINDTE